MAQTTVTLTPNEDSVLLVSNWYATVGNGSAQGAAIYCTSGPQSPTKDITFDLTSIPADKGIVEALLTWDIATWAEGSSSTPTMGFGAEHAKVFPGAQQTSYGVSGMDEQGIFTLRVTPGSIFTVRLYYKPGIPSQWYVPSKNYGIGSCNGYCQFSNIRLKVTYSDISN